MAGNNMFIALISAIIVVLLLLGLNNAESDQDSSTQDVFEGDIAGIDSRLFVASLRGEAASNGVVNEALRYPNGTVPYKISSEFDHGQRDLILRAMDGFQDRTCINFQERTEQTNYILIFPGGQGCSSWIGRQGSGPQGVSLQVPNCAEFGIIQHELMHALGFWHEQSRTDRDEYVDIFWNNIPSGNEYRIRFSIKLHFKHPCQGAITTKYVPSTLEGGQLNPNFYNYSDVESTAFGLPYDFDSVMHYSANAFARDQSRPTIQPKERYRHKQIGQRNRLSDIDVEKINIMYKCPRHTKMVPPAISKGSELASGDSLSYNEILVSANWKARLQFNSSNSDLRVYRECGDWMIWRSSSNNSKVMDGSHSIQMQTNGDLVLYDASLVRLWSSNTAGELYAGALLRIDDDGWLCISKRGVCLWRSRGNSSLDSCQQKSPTLIIRGNVSCPVGKEPQPVSNQDDAIVEVEGWKIYFPDNFSSTAIVPLPNAANSRTCLSYCFSGNSHCRLVSYDRNSKACTGFKEHMEGTMIPNPSFALLAVSTRLFSILTDTNLPQMTHLIGADGRYVVNDRRLFDRNTCFRLCRVHPKCNALCFMNDQKPGAKGRVFKSMLCELKTFSKVCPAVTTNPAYTAYVSSD